jgi:hypothetical protein
MAVEPYVSAQLGYANVEWPLGAPLNGRIDDSGIGYGVDVGFAFGRRWAFEVGTFGYDHFDARGTPCAAGAVCAPVVTDVTGTDITILKAALSPRFSIGSVRLFGTFGYFEAKIDTNLALPNSRLRDEGALLGAGARWYFRDPWSVSLQATRFDDNLSQVTVGVGWGLRERRPETVEVELDVAGKRQ